MARILYQDDYVTIIWEARGIIAYYVGTTDYAAHDILLGATLAQACDALRGQANDDIAEAILREELPDVEEWATTYSDGVTEHEALQLPWPAVNAILGKEHTGHPDEDAELVRILLEADAPEWVQGADGWTDKYGWGLIGPKIEDKQEDA